jgi:hypothetical protein
MSEKKYHVKIDRTERETVTRHAKEEQYDRDDTYSEHEIHGFVVLNSDRGWDFILPYDPTNHSMYLVCAFYDTGDSFGRSENKLSLVSLVRNIEDAKAILNALTEDYKAFQSKEKHDYKPVKVRLPVEGTIEELYTATWKGYFEHLKEFRIVSLGGGMSVKF